MWPRAPLAVPAAVPPPAVTVQFASSQFTVNESAGSATIVVILNQPAPSTVTVQYATADGNVELRALFERLHGEGIDSVLVEGGRGMITSVLRDGLVDRLMVCIAPKVLGAGIEAVGDLNIDRLRDAITFRSARFLPCGDDVIFDGEPERAAAAELRWSA